MINLNNQSKVLIGQDKNIMKKLMPLLDKNTKQSKPNPELSKSFLRPSKSEVFLTKKSKKSTSQDTKRSQVSKNDQRITIYTDPTGFIVQYSILGYGLKCDCYIAQSSTKWISKGLKIQFVQPRQNLGKKKVKLEITLSKNHITTIKNGVQHIFSLPEQSKHNFIKVFLTQNWQIQLFTVPNKKTKISQLDSASISQKDIDSVYPLKNIIQADELRKNKLIKSDSKIKISWGNPLKQTDENSSFEFNKSEVLSFGSEKVLGEMSKSTIVDNSKQFPRSPFVKKSWHQCDQTRDSEQDLLGEEKNQQKKKEFSEAKLSRNFHIDLSQWDQCPQKKESIKNSSYSQANFQYRMLGDKPNKCKFFK